MSSSLHTAPHSSEPSVCPADSKFSASSSPTASSQSPSSLLSMESSAANSTTLATAPSLTTTNTTSDLTRVGVHSHGSSPSPPVITPPTHTGASLHSVSPSLFPTQAMYFNNSHTGGAGNSNSIRPSETLSYQASATANISRGATSAHSASRWQSSHSSHAQPGGFSPRSSASCHSSSSAAAASFSSSTLSSSAAVAASSSAPDTSTISSSRPSTNISSPQQHSASDSAHIDTQPHTSSEQYRQQTHFYPAPNQKYFMPIFPAQQQQSVAVYRAPFNVQHASTTAVASASNDAGLKTEPQLHYEQPARLQEQQQSREQVQQQPQNQVRLLSGVERTGAHSSTRADTAHATEYTRLSGNAKDKDKDTSGSRVSPNREHSLFSASASDSSAAFSHGALRTQADAMMSGSAASAASSSSTAHHPARPGDIIATAPYSQPTSSHEPSNGPQPGSPSRQLSLLRCIPGDATVQSTQLAMHSMDTPEIGPQTTVVSWSSRPQSAQLASSGSVLLPDYLVPTSHDGSLLDASGVVTTTAAPHHLQSSLPAGSNVYSASHEMLSQPGTIDSIHQSSSSVANLSSTFGSGSTSSSNSRKSISSGSSSSSGSGSNSNSNSNSNSLPATLSTTTTTTTPEATSNILDALTAEHLQERLRSVSFVDEVTAFPTLQAARSDEDSSPTTIPPTDGQPTPDLNRSAGQTSSHLGSVTPAAEQTTEDDTADHTSEQGTAAELTPSAEQAAQVCTASSSENESELTAVSNLSEASNQPHSASSDRTAEDLWSPGAPLEDPASSETNLAPMQADTTSPPSSDAPDSSSCCSSPREQGAGSTSQSDADTESSEARQDSSHPAVALPADVASDSFDASQDTDAVPPTEVIPPQVLSSEALSTVVLSSDLIPPTLMVHDPAPSDPTAPSAELAPHQREPADS